MVLKKEEVKVGRVTKMYKPWDVYFNTEQDAFDATIMFYATIKRLYNSRPPQITAIKSV